MQFKILLIYIEKFLYQLQKASKKPSPKFLFRCNVGKFKNIPLGLYKRHSPFRLSLCRTHKINSRGCSMNDLKAILEGWFVMEGFIFSLGVEGRLEVLHSRLILARLERLVVPRVIMEGQVIKLEIRKRKKEVLSLKIISNKASRSRGRQRYLVI